MPFECDLHLAGADSGLVGSELNDLAEDVRIAVGARKGADHTLAGEGVDVPGDVGELAGPHRVGVCSEVLPSLGERRRRHHGVVVLAGLETAVDDEFISGSANVGG